MLKDKRVLRSIIKLNEKQSINRLGYTKTSGRKTVLSK